MRMTFEKQLKQLNDSLIEMGTQCQDCITYATQALITGNNEMADTAIHLEKEVDEKHRDIQDICTKLLLRQQPVAHDLKIIQAALKMIVDFQRIGIQGADIATIVKNFDASFGSEADKTRKQNEVLRRDQGSDIAEIIKRNEKTKFKQIILIAQMSDAVIKMLYNAVASFVQRDTEKAQATIEGDTEVDKLFYKIKNELIEMIASDKKSGNEALETLMLAKYLERIGDHIVNVSETVIEMMK